MYKEEIKKLLEKAYEIQEEFKEHIIEVEKIVKDYTRTNFRFTNLIIKYEQKLENKEEITEDEVKQFKEVNKFIKEIIK